MYCTLLDGSMLYSRLPGHYLYWRARAFLSNDIQALFKTRACFLENADHTQHIVVPLPVTWPLSGPSSDCVRPVLAHLIFALC